MKTVVAAVAAAAVLIVSLVSPARAQEQKAQASPPIRVQIMLARYQGDKKIGSLPYTLTVNTDERSRVGRASLRLGTQVPITTMSKQSGDANAPLVPTVSYRDVGTNIDCIVTALQEDGRYKLDLTVEDSSIESADKGPIPANPSFRSFRTSNSLVLKDGQSLQYTTATDKVSAEVWKVDVTLTVVK